MADNSVTLEKLEADEKKAAAVHAEAKAKLATFRAANREPKLAELKKDIADYGFTAVELFGEAVSNTEKPKTKWPKLTCVWSFRSLSDIVVAD